MRGGAWVLVLVAWSACSPFRADVTSSDAGAVQEELDAGLDSSVTLDAGNGADIGKSDAYALGVLADRPVHYWRCNEPASASALKDMVGGRDLVLAGEVVPTLGADKLFTGGGAITFDGSKGSLASAAGVQYLGDANFTFETWFRPNKPTDGNYRHIFEHNLGAASGSGFGIYGHAGQLTIETFHKNGTPHAAPWTEESYPPLAVWHHIVATAGDPLQLFIDGVSVGTPMGTNAGAQPEPQDFTIGTKTANQSSIVGSLAEVALYDHVLSDDRIRAHYNLGKP